MPGYIMPEPDDMGPDAAASVELRAEVQYDHGNHRWRWSSAGELVPSMREAARTPRDLQVMLTVYGRIAARLLEKDKLVLRARVTAHWLPTGGTAIGSYDWYRSAETGRLIPAQEPWTLWPGTMR
ncbi:hypothetical protein K373_01918 [Streptomyces sp. DvalAA-21]|nr:hypothetical protein SACTE_3144 [Streptomyces sp. SirexAA-E]PZX41692.1 hypothetical protein K373_01918 [Streptomyces sp. DvalAA-21]RAJ38089.1 hypothetical protein K351_01665 [Streptomyces sp. DpondAA-E10]RAJ51937.1 hypothetical protein K352_01061 [Streptomyces sp. DpondAA-A50]SCD32935.1 hypothetical protein GA0115235_101174 [Streptomyces sp. DpondAA-F4a]SCL92010.1 hypothetical protein SAMN04883147_1038274 [Streptomyces sp. DpondAA-F4]